MPAFYQKNCFFVGGTNRIRVSVSPWEKDAKYTKEEGRKSGAV